MATLTGTLQITKFENNKLVLKPMKNTVVLLKSATSDVNFKTAEDGKYSIGIKNGTYTVYIGAVNRAMIKLAQTIVVNAATKADALDLLINNPAAEDVDSSLIARFEKLATSTQANATRAENAAKGSLPLRGGTLTGGLIAPYIVVDNSTKAWANVAYKNSFDSYWLTEASGDKFKFIKRDKDNKNLNVHYLPELPEGKNSTLLTAHDAWKSGYELIGNPETESNVLSIFERGNYSSSSIANKWKHLPQGCSNRFNLIVSGTTQNRTCARLEIHDMVSNKRWVNTNTSTDESKAAWTGWEDIGAGIKSIRLATFRIGEPYATGNAGEVMTGSAKDGRHRFRTIQYQINGKWVNAAYA